MVAIPVPPAVKRRYQRPVTPVMPVKGGGRSNQALGLRKQGRPLPNPGGPGSTKAGPTPIAPPMTNRSGVKFAPDGPLRQRMPEKSNVKTKNGFDMNKIQKAAKNRTAAPGLVDKFTKKYKNYGK